MGNLKRRLKYVFKTNYGLMQVKSIAEWEHSAILFTFIKLLFVIKIFVLSFLEWPLKTGLTIQCIQKILRKKVKQRERIENP